jgi:long-chain fatty acid transport protein
MNRRTRSYPFLVMAVIAIGLAAPAIATNGYFTHGEGTANKALAGAGLALPFEALDASNNPAAAAFLPAGYSAALGLFSPDRQYSISGNPSGYPQTFGLTPGTVTSKSTLFPMPSLGMNYRPTSADAINVNFVARGGMNTDYRTNTFYGSDHTGVDLAQAFLTTTWSRKLSDHHALGISGIVAFQRFKASGLQAFAGFSSDPASLTNNGYDTSHGFGVKIGYLGYLRPDLSIGASFTPKIRMSDFTKYRGLFAQGGGFDIPESLAAGVAYHPVQPLTLVVDYERIHYSDVRSIGNHLLPNMMTAPMGSDGGAGFGWNDINVYKAGLQYQPGKDWIWRFGYSKCDQPIPNTEVLFNILAPGVVQQHITAGFSKLLPRSPGRLNVAIMYAPNKTVTGANPLEAPGQQQISLKMHEWEAEIGYSFGF